MLVKFVKIEGQITALFPNEPADFQGNIMSYAHVGQHAAASRVWLKENSVLADELLAELENIGYDDLKVVDNVLYCHHCDNWVADYKIIANAYASQQAYDSFDFGVYAYVECPNCEKEIRVGQASGYMETSYSY